MLRTLFVLLIAAGFLPFALTSPFYALLFYLWVSYFRPEQWVWTGLVASLNLQLIVGAWVVLFAIISRQRLRFGVGPLLLLLFLLQGLISAVASPASGWAWVYWREFLKVALIGYLMIVLVTDERRLRLTIGVMAVSLALEGAKQGWAQLVTNPGAINTNPSPILGDNNGVAIGMLMLLSLLGGLIRTSPWAIERHAHRFLAIGVAYRAISTYSRGGFLSFAALGLHFILHSRRKVTGLLAVAVLAAIIFPVLPDAFWGRMGTLQTAVESEGWLDKSSNSRLHFWRVAILMANDYPLTGVGQNSYSIVYDDYDTTDGAYGRGRAAHSAWFGLVAELGYPGLLLFLLLFARGFYVCWRTRRLARDRPDLATFATYATAVEGALLVAVIGGTFFPFQYIEMLWHTLALTMVIDQIVREKVAEPVPARAPAAATPPLAVSPATRGFTLAGKPAAERQ